MEQEIPVPGETSGAAEAELISPVKIIKAAARICYGEPWQFVGAAALVALPSLVVSLFSMARSTGGERTPAQGIIGLLSLALIACSFVLTVYFIGALPLMTAFRLDGRPMGWTDAFSWISDRRLFWGVFLALLLTGLAVAGGLVLLIVPGFIFGTWFMLAVPARVLGNEPGSKALSASSRMVKPLMLKGALALVGLIIIPMVVLVWPAQGITIALYGVLSTEPARVIPHSVATYLVSVFWGPVVGVSIALLYIERAGGLSSMRKDLFI